MNPEQTAEMLKLLSDIAKSLAMQKYTLTGAADFPIVSVLGGVMIALIAAMWSDLRGVVKQYRSDGKDDLAAHKADSLKNEQIIWDAIHDCQHDCCPRGKNQDRRSTDG